MLNRQSWENAFSVIDPQITADGAHVRPFDPALPVDVRFYLYDRRHQIRMNRHDYFEVFYLASGALTCRIQDRSFRMSSGDLAVISSTHFHTMRLTANHNGVTEARAGALYFLPELIRSSDLTGEEIEYLKPFLWQGDSFPHIIRNRTGIPQRIYELMTMIGAELPATSMRSRVSVKTYLKMILIVLGNYYAGRDGVTENFQRKTQALVQLRPLFEYLEKHYQEQLSVDDAARLVGMSKSHFMRFFKQATGQSFVSYINHFRIAKAQLLLATTDMPATEISQAVGFCDQSYFGLIFRKFSLMTPLQYRRHCRA